MFILDQVVDKMTQKLLLTGMKQFTYSDSSGQPQAILTTEILLKGVITKMTVIAMVTSSFTETPLFYYGLRREEHEAYVEEVDSIYNFLEDEANQEIGYVFHRPDEINGYIPMTTDSESIIVIDHFDRFPVEIGDRISVDLRLHAQNDADRAFTTGGTFDAIVIIEQVVY